jgi:hypothetical protein
MESTASTKTAPRDVAEIKVVREDGKPMIKVSVPRGTPFSKTAQLHDKIDALITKLTGCNSCNSGIPVFIQEHDVIERVVHVDLRDMSEIG